MRLIGLSGHKRSGKNTTYMLAKLLLDEDETGKVVKVNFADALKEMAREEYGWNGIKDDAGRKLLQDLGVSKRSKNPRYWIHLWDFRLFVAKWNGAEWVFVCDVRFPNEVEAIRERGGEVWRIERPGMPQTDRHVSETALDEYHQWDELIVANDLTELMDRIKMALSKRGVDV